MESFDLTRRKLVVRRGMLEECEREEEEYGSIYIMEFVGEAAIALFERVPMLQRSVVALVLLQVVNKLPWKPVPVEPSTVVYGFENGHYLHGEARLP